MTFDVRRVVTDRTTDGTSVFAEVPVAEPQTVLGLEIHNLWGTDDGTPVAGAGQDPSPVPFPFFPGPGGTRFIVVRFPPSRPRRRTATLPRRLPTPSAASRG